MSNVSRGITRCGVVALLVALGAAPGAAAALADPPSTGHHASGPRHAKTGHQASGPRHAKTGQPAASSPKTRPVAHAAPQPATIPATRQPVRPRAQQADGGLGSSVTPHVSAPAPSVAATASASQVDSVVVVAARPATHATALSLLGLAGLELAPTLSSGTLSTPARSVLLLSALSQPARGATRSVAHSSQLVGGALPAQGASGIGSDLRRRATSTADVPVFVAFVGLILVLLGARNVSRFRSVGPDPDTDLAWPTA